MSAAASMLRLLQKTPRILRGNGPVPREELLAALWRLQIQTAFANGGTRLRRERIAGMDVEFFDCASLMLLLQEIFVDQEYAFHARRHDPLVVDAGSNIGMAVLYFKRVYPRTRILAFEPDPLAFAVLDRNVRANHLSDVELRNCALAAHPGKLQLFTDPGRNAALYASTREPLVQMCAGRREPRAVEVQAVRLSDQIHDAVDFLKLDIEGSETAVLEDLARHGKLNQVREIVLECHHHIQPREDGLSRLLALLEDSGFGYQISSGHSGRVPEGAYQNLMIHAYQRELLGTCQGAA